MIARGKGSPSMEELRKTVPGDEPELKRLWSDVFGDDRERVDSFFEKLYTPGMARVYLVDGAIVSAAYIVKLGDFISEGTWMPCRIVHALGTHPAFRGRGYGGKVLAAAVEEATRSGLGAVCPTQPSLSPWLEKYGFRPAFGAVTQDCADVELPLNGSAALVTVRGYAALREELLHGREYIDIDLRALEYRERLCRRSGGGLYYVISDGVRCCAAVEREGERALIRELIVPSGSVYNAAALVSRAVGCTRFTYWTPPRQGDAAAPCAMLHVDSRKTPAGLAWFGPGLD